MCSIPTNKHNQFIKHRSGHKKYVAYTGRAERRAPFIKTLGTKLESSTNISGTISIKKGNIHMYKVFFIALLSVALMGCPLDGDKGKSGSAGISCWDLNGNSVNDASEDVNYDGAWDALDCAGGGSQTTTAQSPEAQLNHQHFCEAFANLGQYPDGCPSNSHSVPAGTLTKMYQDVNNQLFDDGSDGFTTCNNSPNNGLLSIVKRSGTDQAWFELEGGYIARTTVYSRSGEITNELCFADCNSDANCIASLAQYKSSESSECLVFYHSDTVSKFEKICGVDSLAGNARDLCTAGMGNTARWSAKCP